MLAYMCVRVHLRERAQTLCNLCIAPRRHASARQATRLGVLQQLLGVSVRVRAHTHTHTHTRALTRTPIMHANMCRHTIAPLLLEGACSHTHMRTQPSALVASSGSTSCLHKHSRTACTNTHMHACKPQAYLPNARARCVVVQVDELKKRSEDLKREAHIRKRHQEEHRRRLQELELRQIDSNEKFNSLEEEVQVRTAL